MRASSLSLMAACVLAMAPCPAQEPPGSALHVAIDAQDRIVFGQGFNDCDLDALADVVHPQLRFYHDVGGQQDRNAFLAAMQANICPASGPKPIRVLDPGSVQVFPLHDGGVLYGAIHSGVHWFDLREPGKPDVRTGVARFTSVYVLEDGKWWLKDVLSYDHRAAGD
ncbi:nuclear transport factor 2 family protein [Luteimonas aestuarii]|uniref:Nuclear transport factor 2 family protein n=2 Tax=Luteimonas aestuarii TaxID=453837 RepID=A0A4R5TPU0_9GAMM|nr:nuclear transport factor 2 family protein [Luteimonas aestuarii]